MLASAEFAGTGLITGGRDPARRNITTALTGALAGGTGLPRLEVSRLRSTWLAEAAALIGLPAFMRAAGITCSQRLGDMTATLRPWHRGRDGRAAGRDPVTITLAVLEAIIDGSGIALRVEILLPAGVRHRQLRVRTLILGMMLALAGRRPAFLTEVHAALTALPRADQARLGVTEDWASGAHLLTYRQVERTFGLVAGALAKDHPDGAPSAILTAVLDDLLEASIPAWATTTPPPRWPRTGPTSSPGPGHHGAAPPPAPAQRHPGDTAPPTCPGPKANMFFGFYLSAATMVAAEHGQPVPELARRMTLCSCHHDPARALAAVLLTMPAAGIALGDILDDSGYAHRAAEAWAIPLRAAGAQLIQDLHPSDRGPQGTHHGAIIANGNLYCPSHPPPAAPAHPATTRRHPRRDHRTRPAGRRASPAQARPAHRRRHRRLPPRHLPRRRRQDPLPATAQTR